MVLVSSIGLCVQTKLLFVQTKLSFLRIDPTRTYCPVIKDLSAIGNQALFVQNGYQAITLVRVHLYRWDVARHENEFQSKELFSNFEIR